jgi:hypothetical protein
MARYLSPEWVRAFDDALAALDLSDVVAAAAAGSLKAADGAFAVAQVVTDPPGAGGEAGPLPLRTVLTVAAGRAHLVVDPDESVRADVTMVLRYADALAMARGELEPADALADGRVRVRGDLAVLVAGQAVLAAAAERLGSTLADLTDPGDPGDPGD